MTTEAIQFMPEIQSKVNVPKSLHNNFGDFDYRSAEMILETAKPVLLEYKASIVLHDTPEVIGDRPYIKCEAVITFSDGSSAQTQAYAREPLSKKGMDEMQITGATSSYARKYALNGLFALDDGQDSDTLQAPEPISKEQEEHILTQLDQLPEERAEGFNVWMHDSMGVDSVADLTTDNYGRVNSALKQAVAQEKAKAKEADNDADADK